MREIFHALEETTIEVDNDPTAGGEAVLHGPLVAGNGLAVGDDSVVLRCVVETGAMV